MNLVKTLIYSCSVIAMNAGFIGPVFGAEKPPVVACATSLYALDDTGNFVKTPVNVAPSKTAPGAFDGTAYVSLSKKHNARLNVRVIPNKDSYSFAHIGSYTVHVYADAFEATGGAETIRSLGYAEGQSLSPGWISCRLDGKTSFPIQPDGCSYFDIRNVDVQSALLKLNPEPAPVELYRRGILDGKTPFSIGGHCRAWRQR
ncbi:MAG: hypothetical protein K2X47_18515 [Bdellovibrionales bacterium]|nr:hypothetical protein [Bdellovibrionales bacterium]